jgi:acyl-CoA synthetase (AMP-forming)/AMP-acid ligase II
MGARHSGAGCGQGRPCGHPGAALTEEGVINHCRQHLASYKKPTSVVFVEELPKGTFGGKILKRVLREKYGKQ